MRQTFRNVNTNSVIQILRVTYKTISHLDSALLKESTWFVFVIFSNEFVLFVSCSVSELMETDQSDLSVTTPLGPEPTITTPTVRLEVAVCPMRPPRYLTGSYSSPLPCRCCLEVWAAGVFCICCHLGGSNGFMHTYTPAAHGRWSYNWVQVGDMSIISKVLVSCWCTSSTISQRCSIG